MAGGTGGHVFPALAVADVLRKQGNRVHWLGTHYGLEQTVIPRAGYDIRFINIKGLRGKHLLDWMVAPFRLNLTLYLAWVVLSPARGVSPAVCCKGLWWCTSKMPLPV